MRDTSQNNAMAEIALALAMGFFSIMVLTMVSMGGGAMKESALEAGVTVRPSSSSVSGESATKDTVMIHYEGRFLDASLKPVDPVAYQAEGPMILAVSPNLSFAAVMRARKQAGASDITVTTLDERWLATLKEKFK
jgi:hypothetical protein